MSIFNRKNANVINSDDDSDYGSRSHKPTTHSSYGRDGHNSSRDNFSSSRNNLSSRDSYGAGRDNFTRDSYGSSRDNDKFSEKNESSSSRYGNYRNSKYDTNDYSNKFDSSDDDTKTNTRYGANSRRNIRLSSESDDSDSKYDRRRAGTGLNNLKVRPTSSISRPKDKDNISDIDSYDSANVCFFLTILKKLFNFL